MRSGALVVALLLSACARSQTTAAAPAPIASPTRSPAGPLRVHELGRCELEGGAVIEPCRLGYRTFGTLDAERSNAVLVPSWFTGNTEDLVSVVPGELVDTSRFFLILVDAFGDGVSSSPSNSDAQPGTRFPRFSIRDMVVAERRLVDALGIRRLYAVGGISMGGMQAFEWAVTYPDRVARLFSIVGTPRLASSDLLLWNAELSAITSAKAYADGAYEGHPPIPAVVDIHHYALFTPAFRARETPPSAFDAFRAEIERGAQFDWNDWRRQLEAMLGHDVGRDRGGVSAAAKRVEARAVVVVADQDHMVAPGPAVAFGDAIGADVVHLRGDCGHASPRCEPEAVRAAVRALLSR